MTKEQAQFFKDATSYCGNQEIDVRDDYSGRGMYNRETHAIVVDNMTQLLSDAIQYVKETGLDGNTSILESIPDMGQFSTDNMGRSSVVIY